jgi:hypothetical protein
MYLGAICLSAAFTRRDQTPDTTRVHEQCHAHLT